MRNDWNDELRRAYDQGYWDARREFEHHLRLSHEGEINPMRRENYSGRGRGEYGAPEGGYNAMSEYWSGQDRPQRGYTEGRYDEGNDGGRYRQSSFGQVDNGRERSGYGYEDRGGYRDYPPGDRRGAFEHRDDRGFVERAGEEIRSWFGEDDRRDEPRDRGNGDGRWW